MKNGEGKFVDIDNKFLGLTMLGEKLKLSDDTCKIIHEKLTEGLEQIDRKD